MLVRLRLAATMLLCIAALQVAQAASAANEPPSLANGKPMTGPTIEPGSGAAPDLTPEAPAKTRLAYVTETARSPARVWIAAAGGEEAKLLGPGDEPLIAPDGLLVAASLFGTGAGVASGPALAVYAPFGGPARHDYLSLANVIATPLAWSADSRYLAISFQETSIGGHGRSGLAVIDTDSDTLDKIAYGQIFGASFAPDAGDRIAYARAPSLSPGAPVNVFVSGPEGSGTRALTHDGRSLNPLWGPRYIAYDHEQLRAGEASEYQIWLASPARPALRRLTGVPVDPLASGLVPLAFSGDGTRLLAEFEGEDRSEAWTVRVAGARARRLIVRGHSVVGAGISRNGATVLVDEGSFEQPPSHGRIAGVAFSGGRSTVLVAHGAQASWNG
jgi:hypothetical protein